MNVLLFAIGAATGGGICYYHYSKMNKALKKDLSEINQNLLKQRKTASEESIELELELQLKINELKKARGESESTEDRVDDLDFEVTKLEKTNKFLKEENENLTSTIKEYEMLFNAKKDEIEKLKNQLNK